MRTYRNVKYIENLGKNILTSMNAAAQHFVMRQGDQIATQRQRKTWKKTTILKTWRRYWKRSGCLLVSLKKEGKKTISSLWNMQVGPLVNMSEFTFSRVLYTGFHDISNFIFHAKKMCLHAKKLQPLGALHATKNISSASPDVQIKKFSVCWNLS